MWRDFDDDSFDDDMQVDGDSYLDLSGPTAAPGQSGETLRTGYSWLQHFQREHPGYQFVQPGELPDLVRVDDLFEATVALVGMAGVYEESQKAFSVHPGQVEPEYLKLKFREMGDGSLRVIPARCDPKSLRVAYPYLDTGAADEDINSIFPITRLLELEEESYIGAVAQKHLSFMGYLPDPALVAEEIGAGVEILREEGVSLAVLTPADALSHQTMAIIQREIEAAGIATVSVALCRDIVEHIGVPRAVHYRFPFGYTFGDPNDETMHLRILRETLHSCAESEETGAIIDLPYEWLEF